LSPRIRRRVIVRTAWAVAAIAVGVGAWRALTPVAPRLPISPIAALSSSDAGVVSSGRDTESGDPFVGGGSASRSEIEVEAPRIGEAERGTPVAVSGIPFARLVGRTVDEAGFPLAARVSFVARPGDRPIVRGDDPSWTTRSAADGAFVLDIERRSEGFVAAVSDDEALHAVRNGLELSEIGGFLDLGDLVLVRHGVVAGSVMDALGRPIAGARIWSATASTLAASDGRYAVALPGNARTDLMASAAGYVAAETTVDGFPLAGGAVEPVVMDGYDFTLHEALCFRGRVVDAEGLEVEGADVGIFGSDSLRTRTWADGRFEVCGARKSAATAVVMHERGYHRGEVTAGIEATLRLEPAAHAELVVSGVADEEGVDVDLYLRQTDSEGRELHRAPFRSRVVPLGRTSFELIGLHPDVRYLVVASGARTGRSGRLAFTATRRVDAPQRLEIVVGAPGSLSVTAAAPATRVALERGGDLRAEHETVFVDLDASGRTRFAALPAGDYVISGRDASSRRITAYRAIEIESGLESELSLEPLEHASLLIATTGGAPRAGDRAIVELYPESDTGVLGTRGTRVSRFDADGVVRIEGLEPGFALVRYAPSGAPEAAQAERIVRRRVELRGGEVTRVEFDLGHVHRGGLRLSVLDCGVRAAACLVDLEELRERSIEATESADARGCLWFHELPEGEYRVTVRPAVGGAHESRTVSLREHEVLELVIDVASSNLLVDVDRPLPESGGADEHLEIALLDPGGERVLASLPPLRSGPKLRARFERIAARPYEVVLRRVADGAILARADVATPSCREVAVTLR
jgi:hypothetical protein